MVRRAAVCLTDVTSFSSFLCNKSTNQVRVCGSIEISNFLVMAISLRYFVRPLTGTYFFNHRAIGTTVPNMQKLLQDLEKNPYYGKYSARIAELQKTSPEEFLQRVELQQSAKEKEKKTKFASVNTRQYSSVLNPKTSKNDDTPVEDKRLEQIFKIDLVKDKSAAEIQTIWEEYHKNKEVISATIPKNVYGIIQDNMRNYPTFLFPLPRDQGYEFIMCQSFGNSVHFTPLLAYQVHKENAPECLTTVHYTELQDKGLILMRGEYDKNVLNGKEAQCIANQFQMYYCGKDDKKHKMLETFTKSPDAFKHMDLISELENITLV